MRLALTYLFMQCVAALLLPDHAVAAAGERVHRGAAPASARQTYRPCSADVDFPSAVRIDPTATGLPPELAAFPLGWEGTWSDSLPAVLIVEQIDAHYALVVYAWGDAQDRPRGWTRAWARVLAGGKLTFGDDPKLTFTMSQSGTTVSGERVGSGGTATIDTTRCWPYSVSIT